MKKEIEIKILNIDPSKLKRMIKNLGGRQILRSTLMRELYFESPADNRAYSSFRLRSEGNKIFLTLKVKKEDKRFEIRDEYEVEVNNFDTMKNILELAGFKCFRRRGKKRESYRLGNTRIEIDTYPGMNPYAEIESAKKRDKEKYMEIKGYSLA